MSFTEEIQPIVNYLCDNGFNIVDEYNLYVKLESDSTCFIFSKDLREQGLGIYAGKKGSPPHFLSSEIYHQIFAENFKPLEPFPQNFIDFLKNKGKKLVAGDKDILNNLERISLVAAMSYTNQILKAQQLDLMEKAWQEKDYSGFIALMDETEHSVLPKFYNLRYSIATKNLK